MPEHSSDSLLDLTAVPFWQWDTTLAVVTEVDMGIPYDSLHWKREATDTVFRTSLFKHHSLQVQHKAPIARPNNGEPVWIFITLVLLTGLICLYYHLRKIHFLELLKATVDHRVIERIVRDYNLNRSSIMLPMGLLLVAGLCLPVNRLAMPETGIGGYLLLATGVGLLYILRNGLLRLLGNIFEHKAAVNLYITSNYLFHMVEATVVVILLFPLFYLPGGREAMHYIIAGFISLAFAWRFIRGLKFFLTLPNSSSFYLFYYLCIVELIPILVLIKWFLYNGSAS